MHNGIQSSQSSRDGNSQTYIRRRQRLPNKRAQWLLLSKRPKSGHLLSWRRTYRMSRGATSCSLRTRTVASLNRSASSFAILGPLVSLCLPSWRKSGHLILNRRSREGCMYLVFTVFICVLTSLPTYCLVLMFASSLPIYRLCNRCQSSVI